MAHARSARSLLMLAACLAAATAAAGCAVGRDAAGRAVLGVPLGWHPDADALTVGAGTIGTMLGGPAGGAAAASIAAALAGAMGWRKTSADLKRERDERLAAERERAELAGAERGWDDRERAASAQLPLGAAAGQAAGEVTS